jgi:hypothetical protein
MTDQLSADITAARRLGNSRKKIATEMGVSEGIVWRIENKGTYSEAERQTLEPILARLLDRPQRTSPNDVAGHAGPATDRQPAGQLDDGADGGSAPAVVPTTPPPPGVSGPVSDDQPAGSIQRTGVDWTKLRVLATGISDHDAERAAYVGPDRSQGYQLYSNSEIQTFKDCRRRWWLTYFRWMGLKHESSVGALAIGDRIHRALQGWYVPDSGRRVDPRTGLERLIAEDWTKVTGALGSESVDPYLEKRFSAEAVLERAMIEGYMEWLAHEGHDANLKIISSEQYVEADISDLFDDKVKLIAKLDVQAERTSDGVRLFLDHKTVTEFQTWRRLAPIHEQMLHYHLIEWLSTEEGEKRCDGALYNMLRKVKRTSTAKPPFYDRIEVHHNLTELESFKTRMLGTITDIRRVRQQLDDGVDPLTVVYPRPTRDCSWKCDFFQVCGMVDDGSRFEDMLKELYTSRDPLAYYGVNEEMGD